MKYAIIGAGGTGGILGFYMTKADRDVTLIARGRHLAAMQEKGLAVEKMWDGTTEIIPVKAMDMEHYDEQPDVVLVCVKGYSLEDTIPFIQRVAKPSTIVIPVLNIYGTGAKMQEQLPKLLVTDGCIYVSANIKEPGVLIQHGRILRVVYGVRNMSTQKVNIKRAHEEMLDASVAEVISKLVSNPKFSDLIRNKINMEVDTSALDQEIENYKIQLRKLYHNKDTILSDMDSLDYEDKHYQRRKTDLENHLYKTYDKIDEAEELLISAKTKKRALLPDKITGDNIYKALIFFDKLYAQMSEAEKREFLSQLVDNVQIYEERKENGHWLKSIEFKLPIIEKEFTLSLDNDTQNETVACLQRVDM